MMFWPVGNGNGDGDGDGVGGVNEPGKDVQVFSNGMTRQNK